MPRTVYLETFGCQMNELDSELVTSQLRALGYAFTSDAETAKIVLYNTCSVREHAEQKVWSRLGELALRKAGDPELVVGVLGCMAEREGEALLKRMPVVDVLVGPGELDRLPSLLDNAVRTRAVMAEDDRYRRAAHAAHAARLAGQRQAKSDLKHVRSAGQLALAGNTSRRSATLAAAEDNLELLDLSRTVSPDDHSGSAYVRITRGCNKFCTYCVVPFTRGAEVHRPPQHIIDECKRLADAGVVEVTLLGQTVNHYRYELGSAVTVGGVMQPQKGRVYASKKSVDRADPFRGENVTTFADLLRRIHDEVPALRRIRFVTSYPKSFGDDVLSVIRESPRICRYIHCPPQSGSDRLLAAMNRGYTSGEYVEFIDRVREALHQPEIGRPVTLAGDIIVGFPGETDEDYLATTKLLERVRFKNCFIFKYSPRPGTTAYDRLVDDVPEEVKRRRNNELLALQQRISAEVSAEFVGQTLDVFVQGVSKLQERRTVAATTSGIGLTVDGRALAGEQGSTEGMAHGAACEDEHSTVYHEGPVVAEGPVQMAARTDGDLIVFFDLPAGMSAAELTGAIVPVRITETQPLALHGRLAR